MTTHTDPNRRRIDQMIADALLNDEPLDLLIAIDSLTSPDPDIPTDFLNLLRSLDAEQLAQLLLDYEYCPIHRCDIQICRDDDIHF